MRPPKKWGPKQYRVREPDREWLEKEYRVKDQTAREIAEQVGVSFATVCKWLKKMGLTRTRSERGQRWSRIWCDENSVMWQGGKSRPYQVRYLKRTREQVCQWCGARENLQVHHIDHDVLNGSDNNLAWMCFSCNRAESGLYGLVEKGRATWDYDGDSRVLTVRFINMEG